MGTERTDLPIAMPHFTMNLTELNVQVELAS